MTTFPTRSRFLAAVLVAPLVTLIPFLGLAIYVFLSGPLLLPDGSPDDALMRAAVMIVLVSPVLYVLAALFYIFDFYILAKIKRLNKKTLLLSSGFASGGLVFILLSMSVWVDDTAQAMRNLGSSLIAGGFFSFCFALGALVLWEIAFPKAKKELSPEQINKLAE